MTEIYWITRLDMINGWLFVLSVISGITMIACIIAFLLAHEDGRLDEDTKWWINFYKKGIKYSGICFVPLLILSILTPTTNEAFIIYGLGSTIDYIKSDEVAKQLPHKAIVALDKWVENINSENNAGNN